MTDHSIEVSKQLTWLREDITWAMTKPSVLYQLSLKISIDGDMYCVLLGEDLVQGVAGFGPTLEAAMKDFDKRFEEQKATPFSK